jgi:acyl-CoA dehydrogenase
MADKTFLSWPFFDKTHGDLARDLDAWAYEALAGIDHSDTDAACRSLVAALGEAGWAQHSAAMTGERLDVRTLCLIRETLARHDGLADFAFAMQGLGTGAISLFGTQAQQAEWLPLTRSGKAISAFALTEPQSGSDVANSTMTATLDGDHYVLNGEKTWISNGGIADVYTLFARTGEAPGAKGLSAFIVPANLPGFAVVERQTVIAPHPLATLRFTDCRIPKSALLGQAGGGFKIAMSVLDVFRSTVAAAALGFARRALDEALARVSTRQVQGAALFELQMVQGHIADMALDVDAAALLVYRAAWAKDSGAARVTREAAMAKLFSTDQAQQVIDKAVQLHGGDGVRHGQKVEELYRDIRALRIYEGASDVQRVVIARQTLGAYQAETLQARSGQSNKQGGN